MLLFEAFGLKDRMQISSFVAMEMDSGIRGCQRVARAEQSLVSKCETPRTSAGLPAFMLHKGLEDFQSAAA